MISSPNSEPVSLTAAAAEAHVSMQTFRRMLNAGRGPRTYWCGPRRFIRRADLDRWLAALPSSNR